MENQKRIVFILIIIANFLGFYIIINNQQLSLDDKKFCNCEETNIDNDYLGILEIPSINLKKEFYAFDSINNQIDKNILLIKESTMPDEDKGNLILAAHRGNSPVAYFNDLHKIKENDAIIIYYQKKKYIYQYCNRYDVLKNGRVKIKRDDNKTTITLITCKKGKNLQTVFIGYLVDIIDM